MTDTTEQKALALVNAEQAKSGCLPIGAYHGPCMKALCRAIEQHEAFRQEVSDAVENNLTAFAEGTDWTPEKRAAYEALAALIVAKSDPLVEVFDECFHQEVREGETWSEAMARKFRAASEKRGGKIVWGEG